MAKRVMLTTVDNPFNPFTQFDEWFAFDTSKGYDTCNFLAKVANTSDELPENLNELIVEEAIDEIVKCNVLGVYRKVGPDGRSIDVETMST